MMKLTSLALASCLLATAAFAQSADVQTGTVKGALPGYDPACPSPKLWLMLNAKAPQKGEATTAILSLPGNEVTALLPGGGTLNFSAGQLKAAFETADCRIDIDINVKATKTKTE
jgi:hypothetical protein